MTIHEWWTDGRKKKMQDVEADNTIHLLPDTVNVYSYKHIKAVF